MTLADDRNIGEASATSVVAEDECMSSAWDVQTLTERVVAALRTVHDPEIPVNVYDLGLIYRIELVELGLVEIDMTLTAPACPVAGEMLSWVQKAVSDVDGVGKVKVNLVFDPPWDQSKMSEDAKLELGFVSATMLRLCSWRGSHCEAGRGIRPSLPDQGP
jgi:FeS assembly SUF system protein